MTRIVRMRNKEQLQKKNGKEYTMRWDRVVIKENE